MIEFELKDGDKTWVNALTIRSIRGSEVDGYCRVFFDYTTHFTVKGNPSNIATEVFNTLKTIHTGR